MEETCIISDEEEEDKDNNESDNYIDNGIVFTHLNKKYNSDTFFITSSFTFLPSIIDNKTRLILNSKVDFS